MKKKNDTSYKKYLLFLAIFLLLFIIFKGVLIIAILIILSLGMSYIVNNYNLRQYGFELVTFVGVLTGMKYGPLYGLIVSFILITYHMVFGGFIAQYVFWVIPSYSLAGLIAGFFPNSSVSNLGFYLALFTNIINSFFTLIRSPGYLPKYMIFVVTNILFNVFLFNLFGQIIFKLLI